MVVSLFSAVRYRAATWARSAGSGRGLAVAGEEGRERRWWTSLLARGGGVRSSESA